MNLRRAFWLGLILAVIASLAMLCTGCSNILDMAESLILKDEVVAEAAGEVSPQSEYLALVKADTAEAAVDAARAVIEGRWGLRLDTNDLAALSSAMATVQDALQGRALDSEAEALRRLEEMLRALEP